MLNRFLDKNKKLIILCIMVLGIHILGLFLIRNTKIFCNVDDLNCFEAVKFGFSRPIINLFPYLFSSLLLLFFVSDRLKRNAVIAIAIVSAPVLLLVFLSPVNCGSLICSREDLSMITRNFYPIVTVLTLAISGIYFSLRDKTSLKKRWVVTLSILGAIVLILPIVIYALIEA